MRKDYKLERRKYVIGGIVLVIACIYVVRLFSLQVLNDDYKQHADGNAFLKKTQYPSRGLIYDRNGKLLVFNQPAYDITFVPREVTELDTLDFCRTLNITKEQLLKRMKDEEPLDESRLFQIYASGVYDAALGGRVRCIPGKTL